MHVWALGRFGYTGARLFRVRFDPGGIGPPYVVKVDEVAAIQLENEALEQARGYFHDAAAWQYSPVPANGHAALLYQLLESSGGAITELRDLYEDDGSDDDAICDVLNRLYTNCRAAHSSEPEERLLGKEFDWYQRASREDRVAAVVSPSGNLTLWGCDYRNPLQVRDALLATRSRIPVGFTHGDLHPNNVVLDRNDHPALIDFAWAHDGDVTVDYVLMECSLRFLLFPEHVDWQDHHWVTERMAEEDGPEQVIQRYVANPGLVHARRYIRMARAVKTLRDHARVCMTPAADFSHYLTVQWLILYGLSKLESYPFLLCLDALGVIGTRIMGAPA